MCTTINEILDATVDKHFDKHLSELKKSLSIAQAMDSAAQKWGNRNFIYSPGVDGFKGHSFLQLRDDAKYLAAALLEFGFAEANIFLLGENSYEWMVADLAIMGYVGVCVAVNRAWPANDIVDAVRFTDARAILCSRAYKDLALPLRNEIPVWVLEDDLPGLIAKGRKLLQTQSLSLEPRDPDKMAKIIFSSGTTGIPKAVQLSQVNLFFGVDNLYRRAPMGEDDRCYLLIPLHHTYGGIFNFLYPLVLGMEIYLSSGSKQMLTEMQTVKPTVFSGIPRIFETILAQVREMAGDRENASTDKHGNKTRGEGVPVTTDEHADGTADDQTLIENTNIAHALRHVFGGEMRYLFCGGSPIDPTTQQIYKQAGLNMHNAYALTETASSFCIEYADDICLGSVGTHFEDIEVSIDNPDAQGWGEVLVRGDNVFLGYYRNPDASSRAFTDDGYFRSGDIGRLDNNKRLYLKGRCRPMFKTSRGERVYPEDVITKLTADERIVAAKVYCFNGAVAAILYTDLLREDCQALVDKANASLPHYAGIEHFDIRPASDYVAWK